MNNNNNKTYNDYIVNINLLDFVEFIPNTFLNFVNNFNINIKFVKEELIKFNHDQNSSLFNKYNYLNSDKKEYNKLTDLEIKLIVNNHLIYNNVTFLQAICLLWITESSDCIFIPFYNFVEVRIKNPLSNNSTKIGLMEINKYKNMLFKLKLSCNIDIFTTKTDSKSIQLSINEEIIGCRCSIHLSENGEAVTIRLIKFNNNKSVHDSFIFNQIKTIKGMTIIAGPTCSGKTTLFYSILQNLEGFHKITIEDPVEMRFYNIIQSDVNSFINYDDGIKSILRQVPDFIGIGEIRDKYTMQSAIKAALTGHSVICTFHAISVENVFIRLKEMGCLYYENILKHIICLESFTPRYYEVPNHYSNNLIGN